MIEHCHDLPRRPRRRPAGGGTLCEYTPRELIMAVGACRSVSAADRRHDSAAEQHLPANLCR